MLLAANAFATKGSDEPQQHDQPGEKDELQQGAWAALEARTAEPVADVELVFELWTENVQAYHLFRAVETQFVIDQGLPTGLDYCRVRAAPAFRRIPRAEREEVFADVCWMERHWLHERIRLHNESVLRARQQSAAPRFPR